ncbi:MAG: hypothetical protein ABSE25_10650 [Syntrophorhabdales bacterium]
MRKIGLAASLAFILIFTTVSFVQAQSAEDLVKNQSSGVTYYNTWVENGVRWTNRFYIRGDGITWMQTIGDETKNAWPPIKVTNKYREGNKVILETNNLGKFVIDGDIMEHGGVVFTRER